jgi:hypothetical protein
MIHKGTGEGASRRKFIDAATPTAALVNILTECGTAKGGPRTHTRQPGELGVNKPLLRSG